VSAEAPVVDPRLAVAGLSLLGAFLLACNGICTKLGLRYSAVQQAVVVCFAANTLALLLALPLLRPPLDMPPTTALLFALDGALLLLAVWLLFTGVDRVGPAMTYPIKSTAPITALLLAVLLLGEQPSPRVYTGTALAIGGVLALSGEWTAKGLRWQPAILFPVVGAFFFAADNVVRKVALRDVSNPLFGLTIAMATACAIALLARLVWPGARAAPLLDPGTPYFAAAGVLQAGALLAVYAALGIGMVSVVVPLYTSSPLFVLPLSAVFLRGLDRVTPRIVAGATAVVLGVVLVSLY
jgi:drug/metabolite transporter, DME family